MTILPTVRQQLVHAAEALVADGRAPERRRPLLGWALAAASVVLVAGVVIAIGRVGHAAPSRPTGSTPSGGPGLAAPILRTGQAWYFTAMSGQTTFWDPPNRLSPINPPTSAARAAVVSRVGLRSWVLQSGDGTGDGRVVGSSRFVGSAHDRAEWRAAGSPPLISFARTGSTTGASGFQIGGQTFSYGQLLHFPTAPGVVRHMFGGPPAQLQLTQIGQAFEYAPLPPAARATLFDLLVHLPGIERIGAVRDPLGRAGIGFATAVPVGTRAPSITGSPLPQRHELIFDPATKALLADETVLVKTSAVPGIGAGSPLMWTAYVSSEAVPATQVPAITPPPCRQGSVQLEAVPTLVPGQTGEHAYLFRLTNQYGSTCTLDGYPSVSLSHDGRALRFVYRQGGGYYVTARKPRQVTLQPGQKAYFLVAKYRCDVKIAAVATVMYVSRIGLDGAATVELSANHITDLDYCARYPGDAKVDPGNYVTVSPIERTLSATLAPPPQRAP